MLQNNNMFQTQNTDILFNKVEIFYFDLIKMPYFYFTSIISFCRNQNIPGEQSDFNQRFPIENSPVGNFLTSFNHSIINEQLPVLKSLDMKNWINFGVATSIFGSIISLGYILELWQILCLMHVICEYHMTYCNMSNCHMINS